MKTAVIICDSNKLTWEVSAQDVELDTSYDQFLEYIHKSFNLSKDANIKIYQIDDENDIENEDIAIEESGDFSICFEDCDNVYFYVKVKCVGLSSNSV